MSLIAFQRGVAVERKTSRVALTICCAMVVALLPATRALAQEDEEPETVYPAMEPPPDYVGEANERQRTACIITAACDQRAGGAIGGSQGHAGVDPCFIAQNAMRPCTPAQTQPAQPAGVDANIVGTWIMPLGNGLWVLEIQRGGSYRFHSEAGDGVAPNAGSFSARNGHWWLKAANGYTDNGTYSFQAPGIWFTTGQRGTATWRRVSLTAASGKSAQ